jgi:PAS domain S-box-containing protein
VSVSLTAAAIAAAVMFATSEPLADAALLGVVTALAFAIVLAILVAHLLSLRSRRVMSTVDELSDEQLARAAARPNEPAESLGRKLLRVFRPVDDIDRELARRRRNERLLRSYLERDQLYAAVVRSANDAVVTKTLDGKITGWNPAAERLFGHAAEEVIGKSIDIIIPEERRGDLRHILDRIARGEFIDHFETTRMTKDGRVLDVSLSISPVRSSDGGIIGAAKIARDMTEQRRLREQLLQAHKMEAVGLMAGGVAHDFNNLLLVMMIHAELLRDEYEPSDPRLTGITEIIQSIDRARGLTRQLLAFSRKQPSEVAAINLSEVVTGVHSMLRRVLPAHIEIVTLSVDDVWPVRADRGQIEQVLMNLAMNARDAMPSGGRFGIEILNRSLDGRDHDLPAGDYVAMLVSDTGVGIEAEHLGRIFDPFFTTKERGRGTGLGLSMCFGIVTQSGGRLSVESEPGVGTAFMILLPRSSGAEPLSAPEPVAHPMQHGLETILVVEDDQAVMRATVATLRSGGYTVLTAANGDEARRLIDGRDAPLDLVLSDVVMPQLGGPELARHLAEVRPELPVIFMTGYSDYPVTREHGDNRIESQRAIMKPFHPRELLSLVREVLDSTPHAGTPSAASDGAARPISNFE